MLFFTTVTISLLMISANSCDWNPDKGEMRETTNVLETVIPAGDKDAAVDAEPEGEEEEAEEEEGEQQQQKKVAEVGRDSWLSDDWMILLNGTPVF